MPRRPDVPCASCGRLIWGGGGGRPPGERTCQSCRRESHAHGTRQRYRNGCRCDDCRSGNTERLRAYREQRRSDGNPVKSRGSVSRWITDSARLSIYERDNWICAICCNPVDRDADSNADVAPSLDHIIARSRGGSHDPGNLRTAHRRCNSLRGAAV